MNLKNVVVSLSGGLVKNERVAGTILIILSVIFFLVAVVMLVQTFVVHSIPQSGDLTSDVQT